MAAVKPVPERTNRLLLVCVCSRDTLSLYHVKQKLLQQRKHSWSQALEDSDCWRASSNQRPDYKSHAWTYWIWWFSSENTGLLYFKENVTMSGAWRKEGWVGEGQPFKLRVLLYEMLQQTRALYEKTDFSTELTTDTSNTWNHCTCAQRKHSLRAQSRTKQQVTESAAVCSDVLQQEASEMLTISSVRVFSSQIKRDVSKMWRVLPVMWLQLCLCRQNPGLFIERLVWSGQCVQTPPCRPTHTHTHRKPECVCAPDVSWGQEKLSPTRQSLLRCAVFSEELEELVEGSVGLTG